MEKLNFELVDGLLASGGENDDRENAIQLLEVGVREGTLIDVAKVIAGRYALQPHVVIEWYVEVLNRRVQETVELIQKLTQLRVDNAGGQ